MQQPIRSFVLRQGRLSHAQRRAWENLLPRYGIPFNENLLDLNQVFSREAPKIMEIGFGMGESTATIAQSNCGDSPRHVCACRHTNGFVLSNSRDVEPANRELCDNSAQDGIRNTGEEVHPHILHGLYKHVAVNHTRLPPLAV